MTAESTGTLTTEFALRAYEVDVRGRASLATVCNWLQETAGAHAHRLGWSMQALAERGLTWVLVRLLLRLERGVVWGERVTVETWPASTQRLFALRDFVLTSDSGEPVGVATTSWMLMNAASRRPVRPPAELEELAVRSRGRALIDGMEKLPEAGDAATQRQLEVRYGDLDINGHANNVAVISWLLEPLEPEALERRPAELAIEFRGEAVRGDVVVSRAERMAGDASIFVHTLVRAADGREIARARTVWR